MFWRGLIETVGFISEFWTWIPMTHVMVLRTWNQKHSLVAVSAPVVCLIRILCYAILPKDQILFDLGNVQNLEANFSAYRSSHCSFGSQR